MLVFEQSSYYIGSVTGTEITEVLIYMDCHGNREVSEEKSKNLVDWTSKYTRHLCKQGPKYCQENERA